MAAKSTIIEQSFRIGCGRYLQSGGAISLVGEEAARLGTKRAFIIGTKTPFALTAAEIERSLAAEGITAHFHTHEGFCRESQCTRIMESDAFRAADLVIGVGGGNVMDTAKFCAVRAGKPVINLPTTSATCAAYTPLSVLYTDEGRTVGTVHFPVEVNCVIADTAILCRQPARMLLSGTYDSLAKLYEIKQRLIGLTPDEVDIGLYTSYQLSEFIAALLEGKLDTVLDDLREGRETKALSDVIYTLIATTAVISGMARGSNQSALAHQIYESLRTLFPREVYTFLHGELVAVGLIIQIAYNGTDDPAAFRARMHALGMPVSLGEIGIEPSEENLALLYDALRTSAVMEDADETELARLRDAVMMIK